MGDVNEFPLQKMEKGVGKMCKKKRRRKILLHNRKKIYQNQNIYNFEFGEDYFVTAPPTARLFKSISYQRI